MLYVSPGSAPSQCSLVESTDCAWPFISNSTEASGPLYSHEISMPPLLYCACKLQRSISSSSLLLSLLSSLLSSSSSADKSTVVVAASLFVSLSLLTAITCIVYFLPSSTEDREVSLSSVV